MPSRLAFSLLLLVLLMSAIVPFVSVSPVYGSTGQPTLGVTNSDATQPTTFTAGTSYVNATAGSDMAMTDGSVAGYFSIDFGTFGGAQLVTFSGSQFFLYLSKDGLAQISPGDIRYSGPTSFNIVDLTMNAGWRSVTETNGTFYIGQTTGGQEVVTGPLPLQVPNTYTYLKVFDGSTTAVSVGSQNVNPQPGLALTPTSGPAGISVKAIAGGLPPNKVVELGYSYIFYPWGGGSSTLTGNWTTGVNTGPGFFTASAPMLDSKQSYNPHSGLQSISHVNIILSYQRSPHQMLAEATFHETTRVFTGVKSFTPGGGMLFFGNPPPGPYGNDTGFSGSNLLQPVLANVFGTINIAGNNMLIDSPLTFWVGDTQVGSSNTNGSGYFNATISIPVLPAGTGVVKVINNGVVYEFNIEVTPTLVLTPSSGPVGSTVTAQAYGFQPNTKWFLYWFEHSLGDHTWYQVAHGTIGTDGTFNVTVTFVVPNSYGGNHSVSASSTNVTTSLLYSPPHTVAVATAMVTTSVITTTTTTTTTSPTTSTTVTTTTTTSTTTSTSSTPTTTTSTTSATTSTSSSTTSTTAQTGTSTQSTSTTPTPSTQDYTLVYLLLGATAVAALIVVVWALRAKKP